MKRLFKILLCSALVLCLAGCGDTTPATWNTGTAPSSQTTTASESESESETTAATETEAPTETTAGKDTLVIYFSATGTTKAVAERIAAIENADLYEITPAQPYTSADLDYGDKNSRTTKEQNDKKSRPEISSEKIDLTGYKTIYIGYPIWWGEEPRIMDTFVESYDFGDIKVIPFCTSGGSGIGRSGTNLAENAGSGNWQSGQRLASNISDEALADWINSYK